MYEKKKERFTMGRTLLIGLMLLLLVATGCAKSKRPTRDYKIAPGQANSAVTNEIQTVGQYGPQPGLAGAEAPEALPVREWDASQPAVADARGGSGEYHVGPGDVLQVKIFQLLEPDKEAVIQAEVDRTGHIYLPQLNHLYVGELTVEQLRRELIRRLAANFIKDPRVDVAVATFNSKQVMVMGNVNRPGVLALQRDNTTLLEIISQANGLRTPTAPDIEILRGAYNPAGARQAGGAVIDATGKKRERVPVSLLFSEKAADQVNPLIYPGDVVNVMPATDGFIYVSGQVKQPGSKDFRRPLTVMQAVAVCGGETEIANEKKCTIIRRDAEGTESEILVNLERVREGKDDNILIAQNDTIFIPVDGGKKFWYDLKNFFRVGVSSGVSYTYDAARDSGIPSAGTGGF